jgi:bifunctional non-homologous end joining protein LigD
VAVPIAWGELDGFANAHPFSIADARRLIDRAQGKGLAGWGFAEQALPEF